MIQGHELFEQDNLTWLSDRNYLMGFYFDEDNEFNNEHRAFSGPVVATIAVVSIAILAILLIVLANNNTTSGKRNLANSQMMAKSTPTPIVTAVDVAKSYTDAYGNKDIESLYNDKKLRAEDLDFWDMYDNNEPMIVTHKEDDSEDLNGSKKNTETGDADEGSDNNAGEGSDGDADENADKDADEDSDEAADEEPEPTPTPEPEEELLKDVKLNTIDYTNLKKVNQQMSYYLNGNKISKLGVDINSDCGTVDFAALKQNGVDFVMLKVGARGYDSGVISMETNFERNLKAALENNLGVGLYFSSRAVTVAEATEEADYCMSQTYSYDIKYPIAFSYDGELFDESRTDILNRDDRTKMAEAFLKEIESQGYTAMIYGSEDYILDDIIPDKLLQRYDVMLNDSSSMPEYPYLYKMWKYNNNLSVPGIEGVTGYIISFVDYSGR